MSGVGRAVVVGAGPNGLVCALRLAEAGVPVTVVEASSRPGGCVASAEATLPGFVHDLGAGFFPLAALSPAIRDLELEREGLEWIAPPLALAHPLADGRCVSLHRDLDATVASLDAVAPGAGDGWRSVAEPLLRRRQLLVRAALAPFPPVAAGGALALALGPRGLDLARLLLASASGFGAAAFDGRDEPTAWLAGSTMHSDLGPDSAGGAALAVFLHVLAHVASWPIPRGGAGRVTDALVRRLRAAGGELRCATAVERVLCRDGRARGVRLVGGEEIGAESVVPAISLRPFLSLLSHDALPGRLERRLWRWRYGLGTFKVDFALGGPVPWKAADARRAAVVQIGDTIERQAEAAHAAHVGRVPDAPALIVGQQSLHDPTRAPAGEHTLYVYTHVPRHPDLPDGEIADRIERRIEDFAPGFRALVRARSIRSPARLERENPSLVGGDLGGGSYELDQQLVFRPDPRLVRHRTPVRGLYLAGSSVHPGGGVHGACGANAARMVLRDRSPLRAWR